MSTMIKAFGLSNFITILSIIFACGLGWGKINSTVDEFKTIRAADIVRIEKMEISHELLKEKVHGLEKNHVQLASDVKYIVSSIDEIKKLLQTRNISSTK